MFLFFADAASTAVFFVPVWCWPGKEPAMYCNCCSLFFPQSFSLSPHPSSTSPPSLSDVLRCHSCSCIVEPEFSFCPLCGSAL
uniref:Zinc-ribbon 15 domain-containing protein n=1 Tax=Nelumbo nucifera TaxID=4432 RepID=A0A822YL63_NELNU|nr:TPA_asm: hypothetical protein HUJ06_011172 [Nelumbo nucifera]